MDKQKFILVASTAIFAALVLLNFLTVFTPEIGFDALWYHLTLPKLWLFKHQWFFPGGLMYYSVMPRLSETLFIPLVALTGYIGPKFLQFSAGLGAALLTYRISRFLKISKFHSTMATFSFYITWLVSWQSGSAYIDLIRTFLEISALWSLIRGKWLRGSLFLGLAIGTKWLSLGSLAIYALIFGPQIIFPALLIASPWFIIAAYFTRNPVYPLFEPFLSHTLPSFTELIPRILFSPLSLTRPVDDFLTPLAGIFFIITLIHFFYSKGNVRKISLLGLLGILFSVSLNPPSSRFMLPFLPALTISTMYALDRLKHPSLNFFKYVLLASFVFILALRVIAFEKYIPFLTHHQTRDEFLTQMSPKLPDTFIDSDSFVKDNLEGKKIIIDRLHNLYYFPYDFDHTSWVEGDKGYDYLVTVKEDPGNLNMELIHTNQVGIQIFKLK